MVVSAALVGQLALAVKFQTLASYAITLFFVLLVPSFMFLSASYESVLASVHSMHVNGRVWFRTLTPPKLIFTCFYGCTMLSNRNSEVLDSTQIEPDKSKI